MDNEIIAPQGQSLTPELATQNPEVFKTILIEKLATRAPRAALVMQRLIASGLIPTDKTQGADELVHPSGLLLEPNSWVSNSHVDKHLTIGTQQLPPSLKHQLLFEDKEFDYENEVVYRMCHEIAHLFSTLVIERQREKYPKFDELFEIIVENRRINPDRGFSTLGNLDFYKIDGPTIQGNEDFTEFTAKYLYDPDYLKRYLDFLSSPSHSKHREEMGLEGLTPNSAKETFQIIETTTDSEIEV